MDRFRLGVLEFMACWLGGVTAEEVGRVLGLRRESVQKSVIRRYAETFPHALGHRERMRRTVFVEDAAALKLSPSNPDEIATLLRAATIIAEAQDAPPIFPVPVEDVSVPQGLGGREERLRRMTSAIAREHALRVVYVAKTRRIDMTFSPHAVVRTPDRIHVRGHAFEKVSSASYFMDLVPARLLEVSELGEGRYVGDATDLDWHRRRPFTARLRRDLPAPIYDALVEEHDGEKITLHHVRDALRLYYKRAFEARRIDGIEEKIWVIDD